MTRICIVDYGVGNMYSIMKAMRLFSQDVVMSEDPAVLRTASALVLPGQGAFQAGMEGLEKRDLLPEVLRAAKGGKPILGICLGAQLLLEKGWEFGEWPGLGIIPGEVVHFPALQEKVKIPHMGWNAIDLPDKGQWDGTAFVGITPGTEMYFIHSYILRPQMRAHVLAETTYGGVRFSSAIRSGNILGCQFHPEKSGKEGLRIVEGFVRSIG
ncbi:MAG: imidazole glycerol phosphate synthase subunit HisH [Candidatus Peregrinibacteria bacterium]